MHYLIDGHNLIAKMPDIAMDDPNDEALLVLRLRSWAAGSRKRLITVIFDRGLPGGRSKFLSSGQLNVVFAPEGQTADALLINRIRQAANPTEYTLVSSDRQVLKAARARRMKRVSAKNFAKRLADFAQKQKPQPAPSSPDEAEEPNLSEDEVAEWLQLFEAAPKFQPKTNITSPSPRTEEKSAPADRQQDDFKAAKRSDPATLKGGDEQLSSDEVDEWLRLFSQGGAE